MCPPVLTWKCQASAARVMHARSCISHLCRKMSSPVFSLCIFSSFFFCAGRCRGRRHNTDDIAVATPRITSRNVLTRSAVASEVSGKLRWGYHTIMNRDVTHTLRKTHINTHTYRDKINTHMGHIHRHTYANINNMQTQHTHAHMHRKTKTNTIKAASSVYRGPGLMQTITTLFVFIGLITME